MAQEGRQRGQEQPGQGWRGRFSAGASNQISLMKWSKIAEPAGPGATDILSWAP
ncbi:MAG: hypothetical protein HFI04_04380 [Lachnospiraceae bacterium]|nr:hypothetical protein [Lachnospiraceae bacterium]